MVSLLRNSILAKDTYLANKLGWYACEVSELTIAGSLLVAYTFWYHLAVYFE